MKDFFKKKMGILIVILVFIVVIVSIILSLNKNNDGFELSKIYDVYPKEVQELYSNMVEVICNGDLFIDNLEFE